MEAIEQSDGITSDNPDVIELLFITEDYRRCWWWWCLELGDKVSEFLGLAPVFKIAAELG